MRTGMKSRLVWATSLMLLGCAPVAFAQSGDYPKRKAGLWEMQMENGQMQGRQMTMLQCIDDKTDAEMQKRAMQGEARTNCTKASMKKTVTGYEVDSVCKHENTTVTSHGVMTGDFQSAYQVDMQSRFDPPMEGGMKEVRSMMKVRFLGACTDGMKPGDVSMNGMKMNTLQSAKPMSPGDMKNMKPEDMKKMIEQMKKQMGQQQ